MCIIAGGCPLSKSGLNSKPAISVMYHFVIQMGTVIAYVAPDFALRLNLPNWGESVYTTPVLLNFVIILACQVYRYRRVSTLSERQQTKWFLFGFGLIVALIPMAIFTGITGRGGFLSDITEVALWMPLYFGLAIAINIFIIAIGFKK